MALSKGLKIGLGIGGLLLLILFLGWLFKGSANSLTGNKYGSADALKAGKSGSDGAFTDDMAGFMDLYKIPGRPTGNFTATIDETNAYGPSWFKGMNIALTAANVTKWGAEAAKYMNNASLRKPHWEITKGSFLTA